MWHFSEHKNILPLLGIGFIESTTGNPGLMTLVMPYMNNGNLRQLLRNNPDVDRPRIVSLLVYCPIHLTMPFHEDCRNITWIMLLT